MEYTKEMLSLAKAVKHKPFNPLQIHTKSFSGTNLEKVKKYIVKYSKTDFSEYTSLLDSEIILKNKANS